MGPTWFSQTQLYRGQKFEGKITLITYEFFKSFQTLLCGEDPDHFSARICCALVHILLTCGAAPYTPLMPTRFPEAALCGFTWTSGTYSLLQSFFSLLSQGCQGLFLTGLPPPSRRTGSVPNCQATRQSVQRPRPCFPLLSWAYA